MALTTEASLAIKETTAPTLKFLPVITKVSSPPKSVWTSTTSTEVIWGADKKSVVELLSLNSKLLVNESGINCKIFG